MTWLYDPTVLPTDLATATDEEKKNAVRRLIGDTNTDRQLIQDEEIFFYLNTEANLYMAAAQAALAVSRDILGGGMEDQKVGETRIRMKNVGELIRLSNDLRARGRTYQLPSAGGIFLSDREAEEEDTSKLQPAFERGMHDLDDTSAGSRRDVGKRDN